MLPLRQFLLTLRGKLVPSGSISERAVKSGIWATLINVVDRVLQLGKLVVVANFLAPADFGLMGIALLTLAVFQRFSNLGLDAALIQREEIDIDRHLDTAWVMKLGRGVVIAGIAFLAAPYAAQFFSEPRVTDVIRVISLSPILLGLRNPGVIYLQKELEFHKEFVYNLSSTLVSVSVAVVFAILYQNVWALVIGRISADVVKVLASYLIHDYRPWPTFDLKSARELFGYGKWLTASSIVLFLVTQGDDAFIGWFLGSSALGIYQLSYRLSNAPATEITQVISRVVFPTYSKLQDDTARLQSGFFQAITLITSLSFPIAAGIIVVTPYFVRIFLGDQWIPMIVPMQILAIFGASRAIGAATGPLYQAIGRPDIDTKLATGHVLLLAPTIYVATLQRGLAGAAVAIVAVHFVITLVDTYIATTMLNVNYRTLLHRTLFPLMGCSVMGIGVYLLSTYAPLAKGLLSMVSLILFGAVIYGMALAIMNRYLGYPINEVLLTIRGAFS